MSEQNNEILNYSHIFFRDLDSNYLTINKLYGFNLSEIKQPKNLNIYIYIKTLSEKIAKILAANGLTDEASFFKHANTERIYKVDFDKYKNHMLMSMYIYLKKEMSDTTNLHSLLSKSFDKSGDTINLKNIEYSFKSKFIKNNILSSIWGIEQKIEKAKYSIKEEFGDLMSILCRNAQTGPFYNTIIHEVNQEEARNKVVSMLDKNKKAIDEYHKVTVKLKSIKRKFFILPNSEYIKKPLEDFDSNINILIANYKKNKDEYLLLQTTMENINKANAVIQFNEVFDYCEKYKEQKTEKDKLLYILTKDLSFSTNNVQNIRTIIIYDKEKTAFSDNIELITKKVQTNISYPAIDNYMGKVNGFLKNITKDSDSAAKKSLFYLSEQILNYDTVVYLAKKIVQVNLDINSQKLNKKILPNLVYIFTVPNIYIRKDYIDFIVERIKNKDLSELVVYHEQLPHGGVAFGRYGDEIYPLIKKFLLNMSMTYIPYFEAMYFAAVRGKYRYTKQEYDEKKKSNSLCKKYNSDKLLNDLIHIINNEEIPDAYTNEDLKLPDNDLDKKRVQKVIQKIYQNIRIYLFNNKMMEIWEKALDMDFRNNISKKKMINSVLEYSRTLDFGKESLDEYYTIPQTIKPEEARGYIFVGQDSIAELIKTINKEKDNRRKNM